MLSGVLPLILIGDQFGLESDAFLVDGDLRLKAAEAHLDDDVENVEPFVIRRYNDRMTVKRRDDDSLPT